MKPEGAVQGLQKRWIAFVDIVLEQHLPVKEVRRQIYHQHRQRTGQKDRFGAARVDHRIDFGTIPAGNALQKQFGQFQGTLDTDAAGTERPVGPSKEILAGGIVQKKSAIKSAPVTNTGPTRYSLA